MFSSAKHAGRACVVFDAVETENEVERLSRFGRGRLLGFEEVPTAVRIAADSGATVDIGDVVVPTRCESAPMSGNKRRNAERVEVDVAMKS